MPLIGSSDIFCSGAVVDWYNNAAVDLGQAAPIPCEGQCLSPQAMIGLLQKLTDWEYVGRFGS